MWLVWSLLLFSELRCACHMIEVNDCRIGELAGTELFIGASVCLFKLLAGEIIFGEVWGKMIRFGF